MKTKKIAIGIILLLIISQISCFSVIGDDTSKFEKLSDDNLDAKENNLNPEKEGLIFSVVLYFINGPIAGYSIENGRYVFNCIDVKVTRLVTMLFIVIPLIVQMDSERFVNEEFSPRYAFKFRGLLTETRACGMMIGIG